MGRILVPLHCVFVVLVLVVGGRTVAADEEVTRKPCRVDFSKPQRAHSHSDIFGDGVKEKVKLNETVCFMISPKDADGNRLDKDCEPPSTHYVVTIKSADDRIFTRAVLQHLPHEGFHMACYKLMEPGKYQVSVFLTSLDYARSFEHKSLPTERFPHVHVKDFQVAAEASDPEAYARKKKRHEASLPPCSAETRQEWRGSEGRWIDNYWHPFNCQLKRISPGDARNCLGGKRLLLIGDTQQLAQYSTALAFLSSFDQCSFASDFEGATSLPTIRCDKMRSPGHTAFDPDSAGKQKVGVHRTEFDNGVSVVFYGTAVNGFGIARVPPFGNETSPSRRRRLQEGTMSRRSRRTRKRRQSSEDSDGERKTWVLDARHDIEEGAVLSENRAKAALAEMEDRAKGSITVVFVAHTRASDLLYREWMVDPKRKGPLAYDYAPFDHILATSGVHDLFLFDAVKKYEEALENEYFPSLRLATKGDVSKGVTWMGSWSIAQNNLPEAKLSSTNAGRAAIFDQATERAAKSWNIPYLDMGPLTQSRPDLSIGPAHYSWPIGRAVLELWLGSICPDLESKPTC